MKAGDTAWVLVSAALVLFMTPGLALFYGGMDRTRNVLNMLMMNFWCLLIIPVLWVVVGFSIALEHPACDVPCLVRTLVAAGAELHAVIPEQAPLEDVYLTLLERDENGSGK